MTTKELAEFEDFCLSHIRLYNVVPGHFESSLGNSYGSKTCWDKAFLLHLFQRLK